MKETFRGAVFPWHCDQFGHMNVRWYAHFFDDAAFHLWSIHDIGLKPMHDKGIHTVVARTTTEYLKELKAGELVVVSSGFVGLGSKSINYHQKMLNADTGALHASQDGVEVFFDPATRRSIAIPEDIRAVIEINLVKDSSEKP